MEPTSLFTFFLQWGLAGVILFVCGSYVWSKDKETSKTLKESAEMHTKEMISMQQLHRAERVELVQTISAQHKEALDVSKDVSDALRKNSQAFIELSTLIRDRK